MRGARRPPPSRGQALVQHHARQRPPLALAPMRPLARRLGHDARPLQMQLEPGVAPAEAVVLDEMLVERLDREARVALAVEPLHFLGPVRRDPPARGPAEPAVDEAGLAGLPRQARVQRRNVRSLTPSNAAASAWLSSANSQAECSKTSPCAPPLGLLSGASNPPKGPRLTGQIVRYLNRTYRVLRTEIVRDECARYA